MAEASDMFSIMQHEWNEETSHRLSAGRFLRKILACSRHEADIHGRPQDPAWHAPLSLGFRYRCVPIRKRTNPGRCSSTFSGIYGSLARGHSGK